MYVCLCKGIRESDLREFGRQEDPTAEALIAHYGLDDDDCCGTCIGRIISVLDLAREGRADTRPARRE